MSKRAREVGQTGRVQRVRRQTLKGAVPSLTESLDRWERWIDELEHHPLDRYEYEGLLLHREVMADELEIVGDPELFRRADELDSRFDALTIDAPDSPFAPGSNLSTVSDRQKQGRWWTRLPASVESRDYTLIG